MKEKDGKKTKKRKLYISTKTFIFLSLALLILVCMTLFTISMDYSYKVKLKNDFADRVKERAQVLAEQIAQYDFDLDNSENSLATDIDQVAGVMDGRILILNREYEIIKDSYNLKQDSYLVSSLVIDIMTGIKAENVRAGFDYVEVMLPIKGKESSEIRGVIIMTASLDDYNNARIFIINRSLLFLLVIFLFGIIVAAWISRISMRELEHINRQISHMSDGNLDTEIAVKGFSETRNLARNYNAVLSKLNSIESTRQEFVSNVSHELKTPITSMKVLAESVLQNEDATVDVYKEFMTDIVAEIDRETKIINDLLFLVKTDKKSVELNIAKTDINELVEVILKRVTPIANQRGIELIYESYREIQAEVDDVKLSLALSNLIENAIKYNVDNGWVKVSLNADHKYFHVKVADSGVGIPDDCKDMVFDRFYRVDKARSRDTGGTGLGLAIARNSILVHGGTIKLYSESGKGTTFTVKVPIQHTDEKPEERA